MQLNARLSNFVFSFPPKPTQKSWKAILTPALFFSGLFFLCYYLVHLKAYNDGLSSHLYSFGRSSDLVILTGLSLYYSFLFLLLGVAVYYVMHLLIHERHRINLSVILISAALLFFAWPQAVKLRLYVQQQHIGSINHADKIHDVFLENKKQTSVQIQQNILHSIVQNTHTEAKTLEAILAAYQNDKNGLNIHLIKKIAMHQNISASSLQQLIHFQSLEKDRDLYLKVASYILQNPHVPAEIVQVIWENELDKAKNANEDTPYSQEIVLAISQHSHASTEVLSDIIEHIKIGTINKQFGYIEKNLAFHANTSSEVSAEIWDKFNFGEMHELLLSTLEFNEENTDVTPNMLVKAVEKLIDGTLVDTQGVLRSALIHNPNTPKQALNKLKQLPEPA